MLGVLTWIFALQRVALHKRCGAEEHLRPWSRLGHLGELLQTEVWAHLVPVAAVPWHTKCSAHWDASGYLRLLVPRPRKLLAASHGPSPARNGWDGAALIVWHLPSEEAGSNIRRRGYPSLWGRDRQWLWSVPCFWQRSEEMRCCNGQELILGSGARTDGRAAPSTMLGCTAWLRSEASRDLWRSSCPTPLPRAGAANAG